MILEEIRAALFRLRDPEYRAFQSKLLPTVPPETVVGVRTPALRRLAKDLAGREDLETFLDDLPHKYFDENQLHAFLLSGMKDYPACAARVNAFLPCVDNWATCDQMSPKVFKKHKPALLEEITGWLASDRTYTIRFGLGMLMEHFLDGDFEPRFPEMAAALRSEEYYVNMMIAWYFATALAKQYEAVLPYLVERRLAPWTHNMTIRKACESYRVPPERKEYLRSLRLPTKQS